MTLEDRATALMETIRHEHDARESLCHQCVGVPYRLREDIMETLRAVRDEALEEAANVAAKKADAIDTFRCPTVEACRGRPGYGSSRQYGTLANIARRVAIEITNRILDLKRGE